MKYRKIKHFINRNKYLLLAGLFALVSIFLLIVWLIDNSNNKDYSMMKEVAEQEYVYIKDKIYDSKLKRYVDVPYLNINSEDAVKINENIIDTYNKIIINNGYTCNYSFYISSDNILSLVISTKYSEVDNTLYETYKYFTYNYDLKKNRYLSDEEVLKKFNVSDEKVEAFLENKFFNSYYLLVDKNIIDSTECSFKTFLEIKEINNMLDDVSYSIEGDSLIVYRPFAITSVFDDDKYFNENNFRYVVIDKSK